MSENSREIPDAETIDGENKKRGDKIEFTLIRGSEEDRNYPILQAKELNDICDLTLDENERRVFENFLWQEPEAFGELLSSLAERDFKNELPIGEPTFTYRRNLQECERLRQSVLLLRDKGEVDLNEEWSGALFEDSITLLAFERRKARWLETYYYPKLYERALESARAEVNQFLIRQKNIAELEHFKDLANVEIALEDEITYLLNRHNPDSMGTFIKGTNKIKIRIPEFYSKEDEWEVFNVAVHEIVHYITDQSCESMESFATDETPSLSSKEQRAMETKELREGLTELITCLIAKDHLEHYKTTLKGQQVSTLGLMNRAYSEYTLVVKQIFSKIPFSCFLDAMLNSQGLERLKNKFDEEFKEQDALVTYARRLRLLYMTPKDRT